MSKTFLHYLFDPKYSASCKTLYNKDNNKYSFSYITDNKQTKETDESSIDSLLTQESEALGDKIKNTAFSIYDRLRLNNEFAYVMQTNWLNTKNQILAMDVDNPYLGNYKNQDRRISMLESQLVSIEKDIMQERIACWRDVLLPMYHFIDQFHKYQQLKQDKKLLE